MRIIIPNIICQRGGHVRNVAIKKLVLNLKHSLIEIQKSGKRNAQKRKPVEIDLLTLTSSKLGIVHLFVEEAQIPSH
jgi:hypothetical protein